MKVELTRTLVPDDLGSVEFCALCGEDFEVGVVYPILLAGSGMDAGTLCRGCLEFVGRDPSGRFPSQADYERLESQWKSPLYASSEEADRALGL